jgi:hypothetical protein
MSKCFNCKHFKQTAPLDHWVSGYCNWTSPVALPPWLDNFVTSTDNYYGPKREVGKPFTAYEVKSCAAFEQADEQKLKEYDRANQ